MKTQALYFPRPHAVEVREPTLPAILANDILVRVEACGVCYSDVALFHSHDESNFPTFAGHEAAGIVEDIGPTVTSLAVGDAVALLGQGRFSTYTVADATQAVKIPVPVGEDWAKWIVEPIACCVNGVAVAEIMPDDIVAVVGCGFMGLGLIQCLRMSPSRLVVALALRQSSLDLAIKNGADVGLKSNDNALQRIAELAPRRPMPTQYEVPGFPNGPCDVVFEASGTASGLRLASKLTRTGGTLVMFGHQQGEAVFDGTLWHMSGLRVLNASPMISRDFTQVFYRTMGLLERGKLRVDDLITHRSPFEEAQTLLEASNDKDYIKGMITF